MEEVALLRSLLRPPFRNGTAAPFFQGGGPWCWLLFVAWAPANVRAMRTFQDWPQLVQAEILPAHLKAVVWKMTLAIYLNSEYYQTKPTCCLNRWKLVKNLYSNMLRIQFCYKLWSMTYESSPSGTDGSYFERLSFTFKTQQLPLYDVLICWCFLEGNRSHLLITSHVSCLPF